MCLGVLGYWGEWKVEYYEYYEIGIKRMFGVYWLLGFGRSIGDEWEEIERRFWGVGEN